MAQFQNGDNQLAECLIELGFPFRPIPSNLAALEQCNIAYSVTL